jgi:mRNA interferase MazF
MASRSEIWLSDLSPVQGREQAGTRPVLVVSADAFNHGPAQLVVVVPLTTRDGGIPLRVRIEPPDGGVREPSFAMCDAVRSISTEQLVRRWGIVEQTTIAAVEDRLRILLEL